MKEKTLGIGRKGHCFLYGATFLGFGIAGLEGNIWYLLTIIGIAMMVYAFGRACAEEFQTTEALEEEEEEEKEDE